MSSEAPDDAVGAGVEEANRGRAGDDSGGKRVWARKFGAAGLFFIVGAAVIGIFFLLVYFVWYPQPFFEIEDMRRSVAIAPALFLVLASSLIVVIYSPVKLALRHDLGVIIFVQLAVFVWAVVVTYIHRPVYLAFVGDMFTLVAADEIVGRPRPDLQGNGWDGPRAVYVRLPRDMNTLLSLSLQYQQDGGSFGAMASAYEPLAQHLSEVLQSGVDIHKRSRQTPSLGHAVEQLVMDYGGRPDDYAFVPVEGHTRFALVVLRRSDGQLVTALYER
jgi:hypothetical protein